MNRGDRNVTVLLLGCLLAAGAAMTQGGEPAAADTALEVVSSASTRYYEIDGDSSDELWHALAGGANPLAAGQAAGQRHLGDSRLDYSYSFESARDRSAGYCRVSSARIEIHYTTLLPALADEWSKPERLRRQWQALQAIVSEHESGHVAIYRGLERDIPAAIAALGPTPCDRLAAAVDVAVHNTAASAQLASVRYDATTTAALQVASSN